MNKFLHKLLIVCFTCTVAALLGCHEMKIETTLNADGGGRRHMELLAEDDGEDSTFTLAEYRELMGVTEERGWSHTKSSRKQKHSDMISDFHSFTRTAAAADFRELAEMSGDICIKSTNKNPAFFDVYFANSIEVETGVSPTGRTIVYREVFAWTGLTEALVDYRLEKFRSSLEKTYPKLEPGEINEWFGFVKGTFLASVDNGLLQISKGNRARRFARSIDRVVGYAQKMIGSHDPGADDSFIVHITWSLFVDWVEFDETAEEMDLIGAILADGLDMTVRVDIPGRVVETNADRQEVYADPAAGRQELVWEVDPTDAMSRPIEIYVKSEIPK